MLSFDLLRTGTRLNLATPKGLSVMPNMKKLASLRKQTINIPLKSAVFLFYFAALPAEKALGVVWAVETDTLGFHVTAAQKPGTR